MVDTTQIQTAAIVFPIIVLIANSAINSVGTDDDNVYRVFVGGMGILALVTAMVAATLLFWGGLVETETVTAYSFLLAAMVVVFFLVVGIMVHEISRGLESDADRTYVFVGVGVFLAFGLVVSQIL